MTSWTSRYLTLTAANSELIAKVGDQAEQDEGGDAAQMFEEIPTP